VTVSEFEFVVVVVVVVVEVGIEMVTDPKVYEFAEENKQHSNVRKQTRE
jgi:hypothetical protein